MPRLQTLTCVVLALSAAAFAQPQPAWPKFRYEKIAEGLEFPTFITSARDGSGRLFIVEQRGLVRILKDGKLNDKPFLDISADVVFDAAEQGMYSIAFPPDYARKQYFYLAYTNLSLKTVIARFRTAADDPDAADTASEAPILVIDTPTREHKSGQLAFSPKDGYLYIGVGDGGPAEDPADNGQNPNTLLGKILRIDVESGEFPYRIPDTNPWVVRPGRRPEIWAMGFRNPWRFSFDRQTGDLYISDVGQNRYEEINFQPAESAGGENYGWRRMEGFHCFDPEDCSTEGLTLPVLEYDHSSGTCAVTGGYVYRGAAYPFANGLYLFGDYCSGRVWGATASRGSWQMQELSYTEMDISTFGEDEAGELYIPYYTLGEIYRVRFEAGDTAQ